MVLTCPYSTCDLAEPQAYNTLFQAKMNDCNYNADGDYYFKLSNIDSTDFILGENCDRFCNVGQYGMCAIAMMCDHPLVSTTIFQ